MEIFMADFHLPFRQNALISRHFQTLRVTHISAAFSALFRKIRTAGFPDEYRLQLPPPRKNAQNVSKIRIDGKLGMEMRTWFRRPATEVFSRNSNTKQDGKGF